MKDAIVIDDSDDGKSDVSEDAGRFNTQDVLSQPLLSKPPPCRAIGDLTMNKNDFNSFFPSSRLRSHTVWCASTHSRATGALLPKLVACDMAHWLSCFDHFCLAIAV
jgi:hypothetical protein